MTYQEKTKAELIEALTSAEAKIEQLEDTLQEERNVHQALVEALQVGVFQTDATGNCIDVNDRWLAFAGLTEEEAMGEGWSGAIHPDDRELVSAEWYQSAEEQRPFQLEYRFQRPDGQVTWLLGQTVAVLGEGDTVAGYVGAVTDITERRQISETLQQNQQLLTGIIDAIPAIIFAKNVQGEYILANKTFHGLFEVKPGDIVGKTDYDIFPSEAADKILADDQQILQSSDLWEYEETVPHPDHSLHIYRTVKFPLLDAEENQIHGLGAIATNITKHKQATERIRESQRMLKDILDNIPSFVFWKDAELVYQGCNILFAQAAGLEDSSEIIGKTDFDLPWKDTEAEQYRADDRQVIESGQPKLNILETQLQADGTQRWVRTSKIPLSDENDSGRVRGVLGIFDDISELKQAELERTRLQQEIIEAQKQAIQELSVPIIPVMAGIIVMPLIGSIDSMRARDLMRTLLEGISQHRAKVIILDITGVPMVDTGIAAHLDKTIQAARLKGSRAIVTGISDAVAESIVDLGIDWSQVETLRDLQTGLVVALQTLGFELRSSQ